MAVEILPVLRERGEEESAMDEAYKLQVKIGQAEFTAEGSEVAVKADYQKFLDALSLQPAPKRQAEISESVNGKSTTALNTTEVGSELMQRVFQGEAKKGIVSLRLLPSDGPNRYADAAILILYGFSRLLGQREVPVTKLKVSLVRSGIQVDRVSDLMRVHPEWVIKGGSRIGGRYSLNNQGLAQAEAWLTEWFS